MESTSKQESSRPKLTTVLVNKANDKPKAKSDLPKQQQHNNINKNRRRRLRSRFGMKPVVTVRPFSVNGHELPANIGEADRSRLIRRLQRRRERRAEEGEGRGFLQHHQQTALRAAEQRFREEFWAHMHRQQIQLNRELQEAAGPTTTTTNNNTTTTTTTPTPTPTPTPTITTTVELGGDVVVFEEVATADGEEEAFFRALNRG